MEGQNPDLLPLQEPPAYEFESERTLNNSSPVPPPIFRRSSSNLLRNALSPQSSASRGSSSPPPLSSHLHHMKQKPSKINHEPHKPSVEAQKHLDKLGGTPLTSVLSHCQTEYFDVLPSFQMFQLILKRDNSQFLENLLVKPPVYEASDLSRPQSPVKGSSSNHLASLSRPAEYSIQDNADNLDSHHQDDDEQEIVQSDQQTSENYGLTVLDNIDRLPKATNSPISIQIFVTKDVPQPHFPTVNETRIKEYSPGDAVNGYILLTNNLDKPVNFGIFLVTMEGTVKCTERASKEGNGTFGRIRKMTTKKFLKMFDLNALYGYTMVPNLAGVDYKPFSKDEFDGSILGLPDERVLQPNTTYKKYFTFRFPERLLDNTCVNNVMSHVLPPPLMGFDYTCFGGRGTMVAMNKTLGYGFLNIRGTPLLTRDYAFDDTSINYTIEAKFIDKVSSPNAQFLHHDINDRERIEDYLVLASSQYFLRFIPDLSKQLQYFNTDYHFGTDSFGEAGIDGKLFKLYLNMNTWRSFNEKTYLLQKEIDLKFLELEVGQDEIKRKNLMTTNISTLSKGIENIEAKDQLMRTLAKSTEPLTEDNNHYYESLRMIGSTEQVEIWGKKKKILLSLFIKIGHAKLFAQVPSDLFPYGAPKVLVNYNNGSSSGSGTPLLSPVTSPIGFSLLSPVTSNSNSGLPSLSPVISGGSVSSMSTMNNISEIYAREADHNIRITLVYKPIDGESEPPKISHIETNIISWLYCTDYPLPVHLGYDFFHCDPTSKEVHSSTDDVQVTKNNIQLLKEMAFAYSDIVKSNKLDISRELRLYLESLKTLAAKKDTIKEYYATITEKTHPELLNENSKWRPSLDKSRKRIWTKTIEYPLHTVNKHNITLIPQFQTCLVGRIYCLQVVAKFKGTPSSSDQKEFMDNVLKIDVPILVG